MCELGWGFEGGRKAHDLTIELCQPGLAGVVEDQDGVYHDRDMDLGAPGME